MARRGLRLASLTANATSSHPGPAAGSATARHPETRPLSGQVLFVEPTFLSYRPDKVLRGVGVFAVVLARQLAECGLDVTIAAERSWERKFREAFPGLGGPGAPNAVYAPSLRIKRPLINSLAVLPGLLGRRWDALLINNVGNGLIPMLRALRAGRGVRTVLLANRAPKRAFLRFLRGTATDVMAVNGGIADAFRGVVAGRVTAEYGIADADLYLPRSQPRDPAAPVNFVMLGKLDAPWKGADMVRRAFGAMRPELRARSRLHLLGFAEPPGRGEEGVIEHPFLPYSQVPGFLREMDVFVGASDEHETFCQAMVQAMLTGIPSVVSGIRVFEEKVDAGGGVVFRSESELTAAMESLAGDPERRARMGAAARRTALERYVWDTRRFAEKWLLPA